MKKKISLMILTMIFCLGFTTAAFAGNYFCVMTNKPDNANKIEATTGKLKVANDPTVGRSSDSCGWVMIGGQSSTQYVQLGWLKKVDSYGVVSKYHFAEGNDDNWFGPDVIYGSSYSINSTYTYSIVESTLTEGKYYFYINGSSIGGYLTEDFVPGGVQSGEEVLGDISSTRISGTTINKASVSEWKYRRDGENYVQMKVVTEDPLISSSYFRLDDSEMPTLGKFYMWDTRL